MNPVLSVEDVRLLEDKIEGSGISKATLMEKAGEFIARTVAERGAHRVVVLCGFGNNGGDGWVCAEVLTNRGCHVDVVTPLQPDEIHAPLARHVARRASSNSEMAVHVGPSRMEIRELLDAADVVVDAVLGTGGTGELRPPFKIWIEEINDCDKPVVSADVPSGLDAQTGEVADGCVRADQTCTMIALKLGLFSGEGPDYAGNIVCDPLVRNIDDYVDDVDHAAELLGPLDVFDAVHPLPSNIDKYSRGSVLVVAGSADYPGAAIMAAEAAARSGSGYVTVAAPDVCANLIRMALPSVPVMAIPSDSRGAFGAAARSVVCEAAQKYDCVLCGPGMTTASGCASVVTGLLAGDAALILDADALNCLARASIGGIDAVPDLYRREAPLVLTPHYRELSRLVGDDPVSDLTQAVEAAQRIVWACGSSNMAVVAKGPVTAVVGVERVLLPPSGPSSMATAGSGDVLSGILAGTIASEHGEADVWELLVSYAVGVHSYTGFAAAQERGPKSVIATDLIQNIGQAMDALEAEAMQEADRADAEAAERSLSEAGATE